MAFLPGSWSSESAEIATAVSLRAGLLAIDPVGRTTLEVHDRREADGARLHRVRERVRETAKETPTRGSAEYCPRFGMIGDRLKAPFDCLKEGSSEVGAFKLVVLSCLVQLSFGEPVKLDFPIHLSLARASRRTSPAGRAVPGAESHCAARRSASSDQRRSFS
jgi:hypothetical protein